jgi:DNA polymerase-3 subunit epsilon
MLPLYNKKSRIKHELISLKSKIDNKGYQEIHLEPITTIHPEELESFFGFFRSRRHAKAYLADIAKDYSLCEKLLGLEKTNGACFAYRLDRCNGACTGKEKPLLYNLRMLTAFSSTKIQTWPFKGPILIEEKMSEQESEYFLIDKWCYLGNITVDGEGNKKNNFTENLVFDLDIYQILKQYLKNPNNIKRIKNFADLNNELGSI